jgi:putative ABC transport system permease protein
VGAGLLLRTFAELSRVRLGFEPGDTITMRLFLGDREAARRVALLDQIVERVGSLPGVVAAGTIQFLPLSGMTCGTGVWLEGQVPGDPSRASPTNCSLVSGGYFRAMGVPILEGRPFDRRDRADSARVVIVNRAFVRQYFPGAHALGRRILVAGPNQTPAEIVGIAGDVRHGGLTVAPAPTVYLLHAQSPGYITSLVVRTAGNPGAQIPAIRRAIQTVDPSQAISSISTMDEYVAEQLARPTLYAALVAAFAALAVVLAVTGVYGLLAYVVTERTHEIGIRLALGAARAEVFRLVFGQGVRLAAAGLVLGVLIAAALRGLVVSLLFGVAASDSATYVTAAAVFAIAALVAAALPAAAAARVDANAALRHE